VFSLTNTVLIRLDDKRLTADEREKVLELARKLTTRDTGTATAPNGRKLPEAHHRVDRGDL
jgi:sulfur carrier protein ThiS